MLMQPERTDIDALIAIARIRHFMRWYVQTWIAEGHEQAELVRMGGVNQGLLSQIVTKNTLPGMENCGRLARAFGMGMHALVDRANECRAIDRDVARWMKSPSVHGKRRED